MSKTSETLIALMQKDIKIIREKLDEFGDVLKDYQVVKAKVLQHDKILWTITTFIMGGLTSAVLALILI